MATTPLKKVVDHLRRGALRGQGSLPTDGQLLECFINEREQAAFEALVRRHGPMVWGVCRRVLRRHHDAEDAFQATFLVLVRKATSVVPRDMVGNWLYGVAFQTALKARSTAARRRTRESQVSPMPEPEARQDLWCDLQLILDQELSRLPEKYRAPVVLCDLQGKTGKEAARLLGCPDGTLTARLTRARRMLSQRLARKGLAVTAGMLPPLLVQNAASAAVPVAVVSGTIKAAALVAAGKMSAAAALAAPAMTLSEGVVKAMLLSKLKYMLAVVMVIGGTAGGLGLLREALATGQDSGQVPGRAAGSRQQPASPIALARAAQKTDAERIVGAWRINKVRVSGREEPAETFALARLTFTKEGKMNLKITPEDGKEGAYKIVAPGQIDVTFEKSGPGMYKFDGDDRLNICVANDDNNKRPTDFKADNDSRQVLLVLERAKPGEEVPTAEELAKNKGALAKVAEASARMRSQNNLQQIGLAVHLYHENHGNLPLHAIYDKDGKTPLLSWRVAILPYVEQDALYKEFKLDEAWNSPHNKKLIAKMPKIYGPIGAGKTEEGMTYYQVFTGPDTAFNGAKVMRFPDITDGTSNTILAVEAAEPVTWTKPADLTLPKEKEGMPGLGKVFQNGVNAVFFDGHVQLMPHGMSPALLRALVTPTGGENIDKFSK